MSQPLPNLESITNHTAISLDSVLSPYTWVFIGSFVVSFLLTPMMRAVALYYGVIDKPDIRKMHREPVAYLGGVAVFLGFFMGLAVSQLVPMHLQQPGMGKFVQIPLAIVGGASGVVLLGLWDDLLQITPKVKIVGQVAVACALMAAGIGTSLTRQLFESIAVRMSLYNVIVPESVVWWTVLLTSCFLTIGIVVFCCNASNLMDGLDGLCGGVTTIIAIGFITLSAYLATVPGTADKIERDALRLVLSMALLGGVMGFIPFNFNPASIFMGDSGSLFLGFCCATMILLLGEVDLRWLLAAMVMFSLPVLDTALAFARRKLAGRSWFSPDKQHFHHQLVARGLSVKQAVLTAYGLAVFFVLCGLVMVFIRTRYAVGFYIVLFAYIIVASYKMGMVHERPKVKLVLTPETAAAGDVVMGGTELTMMPTHGNEVFVEQEEQV